MSVVNQILDIDALPSASLSPPGGGFGLGDQESINLAVIVRFVRRRHRLMLIWLCVGLLLGIAYAIASPRSYTATAAVLIQDPAAQNPGTPAQSDASHSTYVETQLEVFKSDEVIGRVVDSKKLMDDPEFGRNAGGFRTWLARQVRSLLGWRAPNHEPHYATIVRVRRALTVRRVGTSDVMEIQFTSRDPARSADFAGAVIKSYIASRIAVKQNARAEAARHVAGLLAQLRDKAFPVDPPLAADGESGPEARARFLEQQEQTSTYRALYERLLQQSVGGVDSDYSSDLQVITPPTPPLIARSRLIMVVVITGLGGVLGLTHSLVREAKDDVLRTPEDVQWAHDAGRVVVVPQLNEAELAAGENSALGPQRSYLVRPLPVYEAMGKLAVTLKEAPGRRKRWLIGVVAPADDMGASLIAGQLAKVIADSGSDTCLVDANWRQRAPGAAVCGASANGALSRSAETLELANGTLTLITLRGADSPSELAASMAVVSALEAASADHQCIVVDLHSTAQTVDLEAAIGFLDHVLVVVEAGRATGHELRAVLKLIPHPKLGAVVLNNVLVRARRRHRA